MPASSFFRKMQKYGDNPSNGFMDNMKLQLIKEKQQLGEPLTKAQKYFLANADSNPTIRKNNHNRK